MVRWYYFVMHTGFRWRRFATDTRMLVAPLTALMMIAAACGGGEPLDDTPPVKHTPVAATPTSVVEPVPTSVAGGNIESCPVEKSACEFAAGLEKLLLAGDGTGAAELAFPREVKCVDPKAGMDPAPALCKDKAPGDTVLGFTLGTAHSSGVAVSRPDLAKFYSGLASGASAQASDGYGSGRLRLYSLAADPHKDCETCIQIVMNRIVSQQVSGEPRWNRSLVQFTIEKRNGAWGINFSLTGIQFNDEIRAKLGGGTLSGVTYKLWNPVDGTKPAGPLGLWLGANASVNGSGDCLNLRASATKSAQALACLKDGTKVSVVGGPVVAEGIAWWRVATFAPTAQAGWAAGEFLAVTQ